MCVYAGVRNSSIRLPAFHRLLSCLVHRIHTRAVPIGWWLFYAFSRAIVGFVIMVAIRCGFLRPARPLVSSSLKRTPLGAIIFGVRFTTDSTRQVMKVICMTALLRLMPSSADPPARRYSIVVPTKFITYTVSFFIGGVL
jgi:hypothetical protein